MRHLLLLAVTASFWLIAREANAQLPTLDELGPEIHRFEHAFDGYRVEISRSANGIPSSPDTFPFPDVLETSEDGNFRRALNQWVTNDRQDNGETVRNVRQCAKYISTKEPWGFSATKYSPNPVHLVLTYSHGVRWKHTVRALARSFPGDLLVGSIGGHPLSEYVKEGTCVVKPTGDGGSSALLEITAPNRDVVTVEFSNDGFIKGIEFKEKIDPEEIEPEFKTAGFPMNKTNKAFPIEYQMIDGRRMVASYAGSSVADQNSWTGETKVVSVVPFKKRLGKRIDIDAMEIPNNKFVQVFGEEAIRNEYRNGSIVKIGDPNAIELAKDARFRNPNPLFGVRNMVLGAFLTTMLGIFVWVRIRSG